MMIIDASERKRRVGSPNQLKTSLVYRENRYGCTVDALGERKREREAGRQNASCVVSYLSISDHPYATHLWVSIERNSFTDTLFVLYIYTQ